LRTNSHSNTVYSTENHPKPFSNTFPRFQTIQTHFLHKNTVYCLVFIPFYTNPLLPVRATPARPTNPSTLPRAHTRAYEQRRIFSIRPLRAYTRALESTPLARPPPVRPGTRASKPRAPFSARRHYQLRYSTVPSPTHRHLEVYCPGIHNWAVVVAVRTLKHPLTRTPRCSCCGARLPEPSHAIMVWGSRDTGDDGPITRWPSARPGD
jgi:hypothetical protein